jgi:hypothetical protein
VEKVVEELSRLPIHLGPDSLRIPVPLELRASRGPAMRRNVESGRETRGELVEGVLRRSAVEESIPVAQADVHARRHPKLEVGIGGVVGCRTVRSHPLMLTGNSSSQRSAFLVRAEGGESRVGQCGTAPLPRTLT